ncbi:unnamed protein product, partial [Choristocarpus tenellus]
EGNCITEPNQLLVEIIAATGLRPTDLSGFSDPYCICYLKLPGEHKGDSQQRVVSYRDSRQRNASYRGQRGETYYCEKTLNPKWSGQRFVFRV